MNERNGLRMAVRQVRYENLAFWRNPAAAFFTFAFPLLILVLMTSLLSDATSTVSTVGDVPGSTYFTATILAFSVITACYTNIAMTVTFARDEGVLKRVRGTPLPGWSYLLGKVFLAVLVMALLVVIVGAFGRVVYDIDLPTESLPAFVVTLAVGSAAFCSLGLAVTALIPNADAAPAIVNATILPLLFVSGVFIPLDDAPRWLDTLGDIFPVKPFLEALIESFLPSAADPGGWALADLGVVALWGAAGLLIAARWFSWEPRR
jgi:ABC-2 type transport system permease protein